jgi:protein-tyrosine phosphatase
VWNFLSRKKKQPPSAAIPLLTVDLHSHLMAGIDDGAKSDEESLILLQGLHAAGFRKCITTPHIYAGLYNNTPERISSGLQRLKSICTEHALPLEVEAAAEYFFDHHFFERIAQQDLLTFGKQYVLFELPLNSRPAMLEDMIFKMFLNGYQPVLAHPERYPFFHDRKMVEYDKLKDRGLLFQLNLMSLTGHYTEPIRFVARDLVRHGMVEFAGTDIHREKHLPVIRKAMEDAYYMELLSSGKLLNNTL